jgi:hypothetical protein
MYSPFMRLSRRNYLLWLYRNMSYICYLFIHMAQYNFSQTVSLNFTNLYYYFWPFYMSKGFGIFFSKNSIGSRGYIQFPLLLSYQYWAYKSGLFFISEKVAQLPRLVSKSENFYNQVFWPRTYFRRPLKSKYFRNVLLHYLTLTSTIWQTWRNYFLFANLIVENLELFLIFRFYNSIFFKVYNV